MCKEAFRCKKIKTALAILENPNRVSLQAICKAWGQDQWRKQKRMALASIAEELTAKVLAASNAALHRRQNNPDAAQPGDSSDVAHLAHDNEISPAEPCDAAEPAAPISAAQPEHDNNASAKFTSVREVEEWLASLQDLSLIHI